MTLASGLDVKGGFGAVPAADRAVPLGGLIDALFEGSPPILDRETLRALHMAEAERYWLLQDLEDIRERAAVEPPLLLCVDSAPRRECAHGFGEQRTDCDALTERQDDLPVRKAGLAELEGR